MVTGLSFEEDRDRGEELEDVEQLLVRGVVRQEVSQVDLAECRDRPSERSAPPTANADVVLGVFRLLVLAVESLYRSATARRNSPNPGDQDYAPIPGIGGITAGGSPDLYNELYRTGQAVEVHRSTTSAFAVGGSASLTRAVAALGGDQPGTLPAGLHRVRGAARHLQLFTSIPILLEGQTRLPLQPRRTAPRDDRPGTLGAAPIHSLQPYWKGDPG